MLTWPVCKKLTISYDKAIDKENLREEKDFYSNAPFGRN